MRLFNPQVGMDNGAQLFAVHPSTPISAEGCRGGGDAGRWAPSWGGCCPPKPRTIWPQVDNRPNCWCKRKVQQRHWPLAGSAGLSNSAGAIAGPTVAWLGLRRHGYLFLGLLPQWSPSVLLLLPPSAFFCKSSTAIGEWWHGNMKLSQAVILKTKNW